MAIFNCSAEACWKRFGWEGIDARHFFEGQSNQGFKHAFWSIQNFPVFQAGTQVRVGTFLFNFMFVSFYWLILY